MHLQYIERFRVVTESDFENLEVTEEARKQKMFLDSKWMRSQNNGTPPTSSLLCDSNFQPNVLVIVYENKNRFCQNIQRLCQN